MAKPDAAAKEGAGSRPARKSGVGVRGVAIVLLILAAILLIAGFLVFRTQRFQEWLAQQIEKKTGLVTRMERTRLGWPFVLVAENLRAAPGASRGPAGLAAEEVRCWMGMDMGVHLEFDGSILTLVQDKDGRWTPGFFEWLGPVRDFKAIETVTRGFRDRIRLEVVRGSVLWLDAAGNRISSVEDFDFTFEPLTTGKGETLYYCTLRAMEWVSEDGKTSRRVKASWIFTEDHRCVTISDERSEPVPMAPRTRPRTSVRGGRPRPETE